MFPAKKKKKFDNRVEKSDSKIINEVENLQIHIYIVSSCLLFSPTKYELNYKIGPRKFPINGFF